MFTLAVMLAVGIALAAGSGVLAYRLNWSMPAGGPARWGRSAARRVGAIPAAVAILALGTGAVTILSLPVGYLAKALEHSVDVPTFHYISDRVRGTSHITTLNAKLTVIGNNGNVQVVCLLAGILFAAIWRRNFWVPLVLIASMFFLERYSQRWLAHTVDRGHPPTTLGTFPSGGVARLLAIYGLILVLSVVLLPGLSRGWRVGLYTGLGTMAVIEAFTRVYLSKHWLTDAVGGFIFGYLLLIVATAAAAALNSTHGPTRSGSDSTSGHTRRKDPSRVAVS